MRRKSAHVHLLNTRNSWKLDFDKLILENIMLDLSTLLL